MTGLPMNSKRIVLLIDDTSWQRRAFRMDFEAAGWDVRQAENAEQAHYELTSAAKTGHFVDAVALDLGLPPEKDNPLNIGLKLAQEIRTHYPNLPIMAFTSLVHPDTNDRLVAELLPLNVSLIYTKPLAEDMSLAYFLDLTWRGIFILSPVLARTLSDVVATKPDPLDDRYWETLMLLNHNYTNEEIAANHTQNITYETVRTWLRQIRDKLVDQGELMEDATRRELRQWYRLNYVRYRRYDLT